MDDLDIITLAEAGELLERSATTLRHQVKLGRLRARLVGKTWITTKAEVERYRRESLGQPGRRPFADVLGEPDEPNLLTPTKAPFEDVSGKPGEPNILEDRAPGGSGHRKWSAVKRERRERDSR